MRVYSNRQLKTLPGQATRPTTARVREALFNIWQGRIAGCRWLDLCAGNGSMGAEALCRGAVRVVGIEKSSRACSIISQNWQILAADCKQFQIVRGDAVRQLEKLSGERFDRIYFDPPYASDLYQPVLEAIARFSILEDNGELAVEHDPQRIISPIPPLEVCRQKVYGNTALTFFHLGSESAPD